MLQRQRIVKQYKHKSTSFHCNTVAERTITVWHRLVLVVLVVAPISAEDVVHQTVETVAQRRKDAFVGRGTGVDATATGKAGGCYLRTILRLGRLLDRPIVRAIVTSGTATPLESAQLVNTKRSLRPAGVRRVVVAFAELSPPSPCCCD